MSGVLRGVCACDVQQYVSAKRLACPAIVPLTCPSKLQRRRERDDGGCGLAHRTKFQPEKDLGLYSRNLCVKWRDMLASPAIVHSFYPLESRLIEQNPTLL